MEGDVSTELLTEHVLPDVSVDAFVVVRPWVWGLGWRERVMLYVVLKGELGGTREHRPLQLQEDFAVEGVYLGRGGRLNWLLPINWVFGRKL